ncbi:hypothetical protein BX600DRAFT_442852 [Xylariales sp. PMI_506]|nr:hypothetical protein BX600DRAFT_442852 [Xylariales sp. PMI_506]
MGEIMKRNSLSRSQQHWRVRPVQDFIKSELVSDTFSTTSTGDTTTTTTVRLVVMSDKGKKPERPTFTKFWKKSDSEDPSKQLTFVPYDDKKHDSFSKRQDESNSLIPSFEGVTTASKKKGKKDKSKGSSKHKGSGSSGGDDAGEEEGGDEVDDDNDYNEAEGQQAAAESSSAARAQNRRAQVRRAQLQHRQRKANYIQQLESDISALNRNIEDAELERRMLEHENAAMRQSISSSADLAATAYQHPSQQQQQQYMMDPNAYAQWDDAAAAAAVVAQGYEHDPAAYLAAGDGSAYDVQFAYGDEQWGIPGGVVDATTTGAGLGSEEWDEEAAAAASADPSQYAGDYGAYFDHQSYYDGREGGH